MATDLAAHRYWSVRFGIAGAVLVAVGFLVLWASGALTDSDHPTNAAAGFVAGLMVIAGIFLLFRAWAHHRAGGRP